ncbi:RNA polymerase sigma factor [Maribacter halichondriae]|uniref:RNA polymerase sigma factor n=1 Tax=Maribacter halichondriae TaxID=2980554 RepID=UPI002359A0DC|nr:sigma-70 family RNA polymerase sigma factor [Maribacter sp. Hal144]
MQTKPITNHKPFSQKELVAGVKTNNQQVLQCLYELVFPKVRSLVLKNNGDDAQAKDIFQEAFVSTWRNIKDGRLDDDENVNVEGYLFRIAKNKWMDHLRSANYKKTISHNTSIQIENPSEDEIVENFEKEDQRKRMALRQALDRLGSECKTVLQLFYFERKSMDVISKELNIASASARNKKYRCMEKLRTLSLEIKNNG